MIGMSVVTLNLFLCNVSVGCICRTACQIISLQHNDIRYGSYIPTTLRSLTNVCQCAKRRCLHSANLSAIISLNRFHQFMSQKTTKGNQISTTRPRLRPIVSTNKQYIEIKVCHAFASNWANTTSRCDQTICNYLLKRQNKIFECSPTLRIIGEISYAFEPDFNRYMYIFQLQTM